MLLNICHICEAHVTSPAVQRADVEATGAGLDQNNPLNLSIPSMNRRHVQNNQFYSSYKHNV